MRKKVVEDAKVEVKRLLKAIDELERCAGSHDYSEKRNDPYYENGMFSAAVRRASMDVSRALVSLRRGH
jgi:hypothetical protein